MAHIDYFFATTSPYAYLAGNRLEEIAAKHGATITYKLSDLIKLCGTGGKPARNRHRRGRNTARFECRLGQEKLGLPFILKPRIGPTNGAPFILCDQSPAQNEGGDVELSCAALHDRRFCGRGT